MGGNDWILVDNVCPLPSPLPPALSSTVQRDSSSICHCALKVELRLSFDCSIPTPLRTHPTSTSRKGHSAVGCCAPTAGQSPLISEFSHWGCLKQGRNMGLIH